MVGTIILFFVGIVEGGKLLLQGIITTCTMLLILLMLLFMLLINISMNRYVYTDIKSGLLAIICTHVHSHKQD